MNNKQKEFRKAYNASKRFLHVLDVFHLLKVGGMLDNNIEIVENNGRFVALQEEAKGCVWYTKEDLQCL